jgi:hypothetical protein
MSVAGELLDARRARARSAGNSSAARARYQDESPARRQGPASAAPHSRVIAPSLRRQPCGLPSPPASRYTTLSSTSEAPEIPRTMGETSSTSTALQPIAAAPLAPALPVGALELLPDVGVGINPYWRLVTAFLVGYPPHFSRAYFSDLKVSYASCATAGGHPLTARRHHVDASGWLAKPRSVCPEFGGGAVR